MVALVTGGSDGLGKAIAKRLVASGWQVIIMSPTEEKLKAVSLELGCEYRVGDISDAAQVEKVVQSISKIDALINSAGIWIEGDLATNDPDKIRRVLEVNTLGTILMCRAVIPKMKSAGLGTIINIISMAGLGAKPLRSVYNASKWAITGFTKCLKMETPPEIKVVGIYPALMRTNMFVTAGNPDKDTSKGLNVEEVAKTIEFVLNFGPDVEISAIEIVNPKY